MGYSVGAMVCSIMWYKYYKKTKWLIKENAKITKEWKEDKNYIVLVTDWDEKA